MAEDKVRGRYRALVNLDYPGGKTGTKHADPGTVVDDLPPGDLSWMLKVGAIEKVKEGDA